MMYLEFVKNNVKKLLEEINRVDVQLENFPPKEKFSFYDYGTKAEFLKEYNSVKRKKFKFLSRVKDSDLNEFVYRRELQCLINYRSQLEEKLAQLMATARHFNGKKFTSPIFPNNFVVQSILEYSETEKMDTTELLYMLISLFKSVSSSSKEFIAVIERNIADNFDEKLQLSEEVDLDSLMFVFDKVLKILCTSDFVDRHTTSILGLKNEIDLQYRVKETGQKREELEKKKKALAELGTYIKGDHVVKVVSSLEYFKTLLSDAGVDVVQQEKYVSLMNELICEEEHKEARRLIEKHLGKNDVDLWKEAFVYSNSLEETELAKFLSRILKDIVSLCKYMESMEIPTEVQTTYDIMDEKIRVIKTIMEEKKGKAKGNNVFYYLTDTNNVPYVLNNIEAIDTFQYDDIYRILSRLANGEDGVEFETIDDISFGFMDGNATRILYGKKNGIVVIIEAVANNMYVSRVQDLPTGITDELRRIFENADDSEVKRNQAIYERVILQKLDLNYLGGIETGYSLKKLK